MKVEVTADFLQSWIQHWRSKLQIEQRKCSEIVLHSESLLCFFFFFFTSTHFIFHSISSLFVSRLSSLSLAEIQGHDCRLALSLISPFYTPRTLLTHKWKTEEKKFSFQF